MNEKQNNNFAILNSRLNALPREFTHIHFMGICGVGMASLAGLMKEKGYIITGSDLNPYPPMSTFLKGLGISIFNGYRERNLHPEPDLVIVGNVITRENPEAIELSKLNINYLSFAQAVRIFAIGSRRSIVIAGTHGKTTTAGFCAHLLNQAGLDPGFLVGGIPSNFGRGFMEGKGDYFVIEGDEYDTAFFDKGPKFLHYNPWIALITGIEFDHADIYRDMDHLKASFRKLIEMVPETGLLIVNNDDPVTREMTRWATSRVMSYGVESNAHVMAKNIRFNEGVTTFDITINGEHYAFVSTYLYGIHNVSNILSIAVVSHALGIRPDIFSLSALGYKGIKRRLENIGQINGITIIDDFAHHPTSVKAGILAIKSRFKNRRLIAVFEPRSNTSRRNIFQERYALSFDGADLVMVSEPPLMEKIPLSERFSSKRLVNDLRSRGINAEYFKGASEIISHLVRIAGEGDIILIMSNGAFDNIQPRLLEQLKSSEVKKENISLKAQE